MSQKTLHLKRLIFPILVLLWLFYLPLAFVVYTPYSYPLYCHWNIRCTYLDAPTLEQAPLELTEFFRHQRSTLTPPWSIKETQHMLEVRGMYDKALILFSAITLIFSVDVWRSKHLANYYAYTKTSLRIALGLAALIVVIAPFFGTFWMQVFHPLLFNNELWRTDQNDLSWFLMPKQYFLWVILFLFGMTLLLHLLAMRILGSLKPQEPQNLLEMRKYP